jgi:hypothetical protein
MTYPMVDAFDMPDFGPTGAYSCEVADIRVALFEVFGIPVDGGSDMAQSKKSDPKPAFKVVGNDSPPGNGDDSAKPTDELRTDDEAVLDEYERLAADTILDDDDGDDPGAKDEIAAPLVEKNLPKFANFMSSPVTFALWGASADKAWTSCSLSRPKALPQILRMMSICAGCGSSKR